MAEPDKPGGKNTLPHAVFRNADQIEHLANAEHRKADEMGKLREVLSDFFEWLKQKFT